MSILNIALQNVALERESCPPNIEQLLKRAQSMADIREVSSKNAEVAEAWTATIQPVRDILNGRFERLKLKGGQYW